MEKSSKWHNNGHIGHIENLVDDSLLEIEWILKENSHIKDPTSLYAAEEKIREATNRLSARILAHKIQQSLDDRNTQENAAELIDTMPKKFKNQGPRDVKITTPWGEIIVVKTNYFSQAGKKDKRKNKRKGLFPGLFLLGIHDHLTPKLASEISGIGVIVASYEEARQVLIDRGIFLDTKTIITVAQRYAQRAKIAQREKGYSFSDTLAGCRVIISIDGGRIRIREKKRGPNTKKGLPIGSGAVESAIRRVINLRLKGASIYWLRETAEAMLTLRSYYKSGRWNTLRNQVFSVQAASVI